MGELETLTCPFCDVEPASLAWRSDLVGALRDRFPVSPGHTLILPVRHVATWFEANPWEQQEICRAVAELKRPLDLEFSRRLQHRHQLRSRRRADGDAPPRAPDPKVRRRHGRAPRRHLG